MRKPSVSEMTLREKIGQCLLPYQSEIYLKAEVDYNIKRTPEERKALLDKEQFGVFYGEQIGVFRATEGERRKEDVITLAEDIKNTVTTGEYKKFIDAQSKCMKIPALVATDSEKGAGHVFSDLPFLCEAPCMGSADSEELAFELGASHARELRCAGINWRWSPVVDLGSYRSTATYRSIANDDPERMIRLANAHIRGMQSEGVAATAKHFPSEDRLEYRDSHLCSTMNASSIEEWWSEQGKVFQEIINGGVYSIMVGHVAFPAVDDTKINDVPIPSTLSKRVITDLLKGQMGFEGVVVTDGISMASLNAMMDYENLIISLVNAGNDVILGAKLPSGDIIEQAVKDGRIPESRIDDACSRILNMKEKLGMFENDYFDLPYKAEDVVPHTRKLNMELARKSAVLVRDRKNLLPLKKEDIKNVTIICSTHWDPFFNELSAVKQEFEARGAKVTMQRRLSSSAELKKISDESDLIIYAAYVSAHRPVGLMSLYGEEAWTYYYAFTSGREKSIGVSMGYPYIHYDIMEGADTFVNTHGKSVENMKAFVEGIYGEIPFVGKTPVSLIPEPMKARFRKD